MNDHEYIINPKTNRRVLKTSKLGKQILLAEATFTGMRLSIPCIHSGAVPACLACCTSDTLSYCQVCARVGSEDVLKKHASSEHGQPDPNYPRMNIPNICGCGTTFFTIDNHNPEVHVDEPIIEPNPEHAVWAAYVEEKLKKFKTRGACEIYCPHPVTTWVGGFCRVCMVRHQGGWMCLLCEETCISPPEPHFKGKIAALNLPREPTTDRITGYPCLLCTITCNSLVGAQHHVWNNHVTFNVRCTYDDCSWSPKELAKSEKNYKGHCTQVHKQVYKCVLGEACGFGVSCRSVLQHVLPMHLHRHIMTESVADDIDVTDLINKPGKLALRTYKRWVALAHQPVDKRDETGFPTEIWLKILKHLPIRDLFTMTKVSCHMRDMANEVVDPVERFRFNLDMTVKTEHERMTATRAKVEYCLSETDLQTLPCEHVRNPHYRSAAPMRLYSITFLVNRTIRKYKTWEAFVTRRGKRSHPTNANIERVERFN